MSSLLFENSGLESEINISDIWEWFAVDPEFSVPTVSFSIYWSAIHKLYFQFGFISVSIK